MLTPRSHVRGVAEGPVPKAHFTRSSVLVWDCPECRAGGQGLGADVLGRGGLPNRGWGAGRVRWAAGRAKAGRVAELTVTVAAEDPPGIVPLQDGRLGHGGLGAGGRGCRRPHAPPGVYTVWSSPSPDLPGPWGSGGRQVCRPPSPSVCEIVGHQRGRGCSEGQGECACVGGGAQTDKRGLSSWAWCPLPTPLGSPVRRGAPSPGPRTPSPSRSV